MPSQKSKKLFAVSFGISLAVVAALGVVLLGDFGAKKNKNEGAQTSSVSIKYTPRAEDKFNVFIPLSREYAAEPYAFFLFGFDAARGKVSVTRLFPETVLSDEGESKKILGDEFKKRGVLSAEKAVENYFGTQISSYILFDNSCLMTFLELFEPTRINAPQNLSQIDRERDIYIKIDKGMNLLSSASFVDYLSCTAFSGGANESLYESARAVSEFLCQSGSELFGGENPVCEQFILNKTTTDISVVDIENRRELLSYLFEQENPAFVLAAEGEFKNADTEFVLSEQSRHEISNFLQNP